MAAAGHRWPVAGSRRRGAGGRPESARLATLVPMSKPTPQGADTAAPPRLPPVDWFQPSELVKTGVRVLLSLAFGEHADARILEAISDSKTGGPPEVDLSGAELPFVFDYMADTGDGWDATLTMATALTRGYDDAGGELTFSAKPPGAEDLPPSSVLLLGGDQVYPAANRQAYLSRFEAPFAAVAVPTPLAGNRGDRDRRDAAPRGREVFAIPGNHDWYDSLNAFSRLFCRGDPGRKIGAWKTRQERSYFALRLPRGWWVLGIDVQFGNDIDRPQLDYFRAVAAGMADGDRVILLCSEPEWLRTAEAAVDFDCDHHGHAGGGPGLGEESNLEFFVRRLSSWVPAGVEVEVPLYLAGDWHFYGRHQSDPDPLGRSRQLVICGGGGAFLHHNHWLDEARDLVMPVMVRGGGIVAGESEGRAAEPGVARRRFHLEEKSCFPSLAVSRGLPLGNVFLPWICPSFAGFLALIHAGIFHFWTRGWDLVSALKAPASTTLSPLAESLRRALELGPLTEIFGAKVPGPEAFGRGFEQFFVDVVRDPALSICVFLLALGCWLYKPGKRLGGKVAVALHIGLHVLALAGLFAAMGSLKLWLATGLEVDVPGLLYANNPNAGPVFGLAYGALAGPLLVQFAGCMAVGIPLAWYYAIDRQPNRPPELRGWRAVLHPRVFGLALAGAAGVVAFQVFVMFLAGGWPRGSVKPVQAGIFFVLMSRVMTFVFAYYLATWAVGLYLMACSWLAPECDVLLSGLRITDYKCFLRFQMDEAGALQVDCLGYRRLPGPEGGPPQRIDSFAFPASVSRSGDADREASAQSVATRDASASEAGASGDNAVAAAGASGSGSEDKAAS